ncbi:hypothetical protein SK128_005029 [Halocaridina rubra]|uniref:Uncharacterized protein n=1 Tax=Halocaridina rubra TaxID=373956 RepID=A0AAN8X1X9_HALRR
MLVTCDYLPRETLTLPIWTGIAMTLISPLIIAPCYLPACHVWCACTLTELNLVLEDNLVNWTCTKSSWLNISEADWITFEKLLCKPEKSGYLYQIEELLRPIVYPPALQQLLASHNSSNTSQLLLDVMSFYKALNNTAHTLFSQPWEVNRKKRSALEFIDSYMGELPPGDARTIEVLEYGINDAKTLICLNLAKTGLIELQTANLSHHIPPGILTFINTKQLSDVAGRGILQCIGK